MKRPKKPGVLIVFEGGEGSGKSSHIRLSAQRLRQRGYQVITTHEPGGTKLGLALRYSILQRKHQPNQVTELLLFLADRAQHVSEVIIPALASGKIVLCDRFTGSTLAYQIGGRNLKPVKLVRAMEQFSRFGLIPRRTIYLDVDPQIGLHRKHTQAGKHLTRFEDEALTFHQLVRRYFKTLAKQPNWRLLDANRPLPIVQTEINQLLDVVCP